jgi:hypothetical protein
MNMTYNYSATQNNGQITSSKDAINGETITYQYDALSGCYPRPLRAGVKRMATMVTAT